MHLIKAEIVIISLPKMTRIDTFYLSSLLPVHLIVTENNYDSWCRFIYLIKHVRPFLLYISNHQVTPILLCGLAFWALSYGLYGKENFYSIRRYKIVARIGTMHLNSPLHGHGFFRGERNVQKVLLSFLGKQCAESSWNWKSSPKCWVAKTTATLTKSPVLSSTL